MLKCRFAAHVSFAILISSPIAFGAVPDCASISALPLQNAVIHSELVTDGAFASPVGKAISNLPSFCRVQLTLAPTQDSSIGVELWLPVQNWNGKLQGVGNGGYAGSISYDGLATALRQDYAAVATDTGHQGSAEDATWALNHPEKIIDFGYRAIHLMTSDARLLVRSFYGAPAKYAYFNSCSNGGREALMEAQRFPDDYDGIIAGAPANYWTHLLSNAVANSQALLAAPSSYIPSSKLAAIQAAAQKACDLNDGVKDNVIENPARCRFDTSVLLCKGDDSDSCLSADQITALNKLYAGTHLSNGKSIFPGYVPGGEAAKGNWEAWITGPKPGQGSMYTYGTQFFKNMVYSNPDWDFRSFQPDRDVRAADEKVAGILNATNPDLSAFASHNGKLILYHGWDDAAIAAPNTINYFKSIRKKMGLPKADRAVRLFMIPGMQHCNDGNGASSFGQFGAGGGNPESDIEEALVQWVEKGIAPGRIIASKPGAQITHLICAYPGSAHYVGNSDPASALSYRCETEGAR